MSNHEDAAHLERIAARLRGQDDKKPKPKPVKPDPKPPPPAPETPSIEVRLTDPKAGKRTAIVMTTAVPEFGLAVFEDDAAKGHPWVWQSPEPIKALPSGVTHVTVDLPGPGYKVKAFTPDYAMAHDSELSVAADEPAPPPDPTPTPAPAPTGGAWALHAKMGAAVNIERFTVHHQGANATPYYRRWRDEYGVRGFRFFTPMGAEWHQNTWRAADVRAWFDAVDASLGVEDVVVHFDFTDVLGDWQMTNPDYVKGVDQYVQECAAEVARRAWPASRIMVGSTNEYGGTRGTDQAKGNTFWQPHRFRWNDFIRAALPGHTVVEGPSCWKDPRALFDPNFVPWGGEPAQGVFVPWSDPNKFFDVHHYLDWDAKGMGWLCDQLLAFSKTHDTPVYMGEHGFNSAQGSNADVSSAATWVQRINDQLKFPSVCQIRPAWWASTDGNAWRMIKPGTNELLGNGGLARAVPEWSRTIDAALGR